MGVRTDRTIIKELWTTIDRSRDGFIQYDELRSALQRPRTPPRPSRSAGSLSSSRSAPRLLTPAEGRRIAVDYPGQVVMPATQPRPLMPAAPHPHEMRPSPYLAAETKGGHTIKKGPYFTLGSGNKLNPPVWEHTDLIPRARIEARNCP